MSSRFDVVGVRITIEDAWDDRDDKWYHPKCAPSHRDGYGEYIYTQTELNRWVEENDEGAVCESCGRYL